MLRILYLILFWESKSSYIDGNADHSLLVDHKIAAQSGLHSLVNTQWYLKNRRIFPASCRDKKFGLLIGFDQWFDIWYLRGANQRRFGNEVWRDLLLVLLWLCVAKKASPFVTFRKRVNWINENIGLQPFEQWKPQHR